MLKKEHIICKIASPRIKPLHISVDDATMLAAARGIINIYQHALACGLNRSETDELAGSFTDSSNETAICRGMNKLMLDRCRFSPVQDIDYNAYRRERLLRSADLFKSGKIPETIEEPDLYGDLPGFEKLDYVEAVTPEGLIHHFNLAQAQALLIYSSELKLRLADPDSTALRKVMKAVKFFRLLAKFTVRKKNEVDIAISGPYAIFGPSAKYAVSLASLLGAVVNLKQWKLEAQINFRDRELKLKLDDKSGLYSPGRSFSSIIPEEIRLYHRTFAERSKIWQIVGDTPFLDAGDQEIIFPDLSFQNRETGQIIHLELFHRWHSAQLPRRLELLRRRPELPLIIGIDRALADEETLDRMCGNDADLHKRCWLFRDFPGVENTLRTLKKNST